MSAHKQALRLLEMAKKDVRAIRAIAGSIPDDIETSGFHAQQAAEKTLKAWLCIKKVEYPPTHSVRLLITLLKQAGIDTRELDYLIDLTPFAVQFRYEAFDDVDAQEFNAGEMADKIESLIHLVESAFSAG